MSEIDEAVKDDAAQQSTAPADSASDENNSSEVTDEGTSFDDGEYSADDLKDESDDDNQQTDGNDDDTQSGESDDDTQSQGDDKQDPKAEWDNMSGKAQDRFREAINERNQYRQQLESLKSRQSQLATEQELLDQVNPETGEYYSPDDARRIAIYQANQQEQQRLQQEQAYLQVQDNINHATADIQRALKEFPQLDEKSSEYDATLAADLDAMVQQSAIQDEQGNILGFRQSPYELSKRIVGIASRVSSRERTAGQAKAQRNVEKMMSNADTIPGAAQADTKFERLTTSQMEERLRRQGHDI